MDAALEKLLGQGILGILLVLCLYAIVRLFRLYIETQDKRHTETRELVEVVKSNTLSNDNNTAAVKALGELIKAQGKGE